MAPLFLITTLIIINLTHSTFPTSPTTPTLPTTKNFYEVSLDFLKLDQVYDPTIKTLRGKCCYHFNLL